MARCGNSMVNLVATAVFLMFAWEVWFLVGIGLYMCWWSLGVGILDDFVFQGTFCRWKPRGAIAWCNWWCPVLVWRDPGLCHSKLSLRYLYIHIWGLVYWHWVHTYLFFIFVCRTVLKCMWQARRKHVTKARGVGCNKQLTLATDCNMLELQALHLKY